MLSEAISTKNELIGPTTFSKRKFSHLFQNNFISLLYFLISLTFVDETLIIV